MQRCWKCVDCVWSRYGGWLWISSIYLSLLNPRSVNCHSCPFLSVLPCDSSLLNHLRERLRDKLRVGGWAIAWVESQSLHSHSQFICLRLINNWDTGLASKLSLRSFLSSYSSILQTALSWWSNTYLPNEYAQWLCCWHNLGYNTNLPTNNSEPKSHEMWRKEKSTLVYPEITSKKY